jgi:hypothetical protein
MGPFRGPVVGRPRQPPRGMPFGCTDEQGRRLAGHLADP